MQGMPGWLGFCSASLGAVVLALCLVVLAPTHEAFCAMQPSAQSLERARESVRRSAGLQTEFPVDRSLKNSSRAPEISGKSIAPDISLNAVSPLSIAKLLLAVTALVGLVVLVSSFKGSGWGRSRSRSLKAEEEKAVREATASRMEKAQVQAETIAQAGSFAEAMHVLLLQSVVELRQRLDISIAASLTSREILSRIALSAAGRTAFEDIIRRVEISYFGDHEPDAAEYQACLRSFEALRMALGAGQAVGSADARPNPPSATPPRRDAA